jgi:hypothetical protein
MNVALSINRHFIAIISIVVAAAGCSRKPTPAPPTPAAWSWEQYPQVKQMRLATVACQVLPKASLVINAPISGQLRVYVDQAQTNLSAGFVWAEFEPKVLQMEGEELAEIRHRIEEHEKLFARVELPKEKIKLSKEISEAKIQVALLSLLATNRELASVAAGAVNLNKSGPLKPTTLQQAKEELELLEQNLAYLSETNPAVLGVDLQSARIELERRQLEYDRRSAQARFQMPFNGQLMCSLQFADGLTEYPVVAGQELAVARDVSAVMLRVPLADVSWSSLPTDKLTAAIALPDGRELEARFAYKKVERTMIREEVFYYFQFPPDRTADAGALVGADPVCELRLDLPEAACVIPKLTLILREPSAFQNRHWNEGVAQVLPGAQLLLEGQTDLAILPPPNLQVGKNPVRLAHAEKDQ